jgi:predicted amidohydrolase
VAAVQIRSQSDARASRLAVVEVLGSPALVGCRLIVLPEAAQRQVGGSGEPVAAEPEPLDGPFVEALAIEAARLGATIVAGMWEHAGVDRLPFNTTVVVDEGGLRTCYRKIHLYDALGSLESEGVSAGPVERSNIVTFEIDGLCVGVQTCFDLRFPEMSRLLVDAGAEVLVLGAAWYQGPEKIDQWRTLTAARAIESTAYVVAASQPGPVFSGTSRIIDPRGVVLAEAPEERGAIITATLDKGLVASVRASMPVLEARRIATEAKS